jgi:WxL Interacting Protein, peptidoglycan binding domain
MTRRILSLAALAPLLLPAAAQAALQPVFGLRGIPNPQRGYFVYRLAPGASKTGAVLVTNNGKAAGTVRLYAADGTTGQTTGTVYLTDKKPVRAGAWITLDAASLTLKPGARKVVHFTVHVPAGAKAGQWVAGLVAETEQIAKGQRTKRKASVQVRIRSQTIVAVQVNVPGPKVTKFTLGKASVGGTRGFQQVLVGVTSKGNLLAKPHGTVAIVDAAGKTVETQRFQMDTFLPRTSVDYPVVLKKALGAGTYTAVVHLSYPGASGGEATVTATPAFTVSRQNVQQVFTSSNPTQAASGPTGSSGGGTSTLTIVAIVIGALILVALAVLIWVLLRRKPPAGT